MRFIKLLSSEAHNQYKIIGLQTVNSFIYDSHAWFIFDELIEVFNENKDSGYKKLSNILKVNNNEFKNDLAYDYEYKSILITDSLANKFIELYKDKYSNIYNELHKFIAHEILKSLIGVSL